MSGWFWAWVAGPSGTTTLALCALALGMILGYLTGHRAGWRAAVADLRERREEARAARWLGQIHGQFRRDEALIRWTPPEVAHEWEPAHVASALALTAPAVDELTDSAYTQDMGARMDRFLAGLFQVPYSADELWSGQ